MMEEVIEDSNGESSFEFVGGTMKECVSDVPSHSQIPFQLISSDSEALNKLTDSTSDLKLVGNTTLPVNMPPPAALPVFNIGPRNPMSKTVTEPQSSGQIQSYFSSSDAPFPVSNKTFNYDKEPFMTSPTTPRPIMSAIACESVSQPKPVDPSPAVSAKPSPSTLTTPFSPQMQSSTSNVSSVLPPPPVQPCTDATLQRGPPPVASSSTPLAMQQFMAPTTINSSILPGSSSFRNPSNEIYQSNITQPSPASPSVLTPSNHLGTAPISFDLSGVYVSPSNSHPEPSPSSDSNKGIFTWIKDSVKGNELLNKFAEKAKSSVDTVIYTLDPQMKDFMNASEEINIVVASDKEVKVGPIRQAFQSTFIQASVGGIASQANIAQQPVGYVSAIKGAEERILNLRQRGIIHPHQPVVAVENFLLEATPDNWFDIGCLLLQDPKRGLTLKTFTQATPVPPHFVIQIQDCTPNDYPLRWSGFAMSIGQVVGSAMNVPHNEWHEALVGVSRREMILLAARVLAGQYKSHINVATPQTMTL